MVVFDTEMGDYMKQLSRIVIFTIIFMMLIVPLNTVLATDINTEDYNPDNIKTNSPSILLMDAKTGNILYSKNAFEQMYPASTTKLMTAILTLENCKLNDIVTVSHNAIFSIPVGYSHASLQEGEELTVEQLLNVLLIPSANDAAVALAEHISGSVEEFANLMNQRAKELGCLNTHFVNPNGVHNENHYSTAYDLALIGRYAMKFDDIMRIAKVEQYTLPKTNKYDKTDRIFNTTNGLVTKNDEYYYPNATGIKTGYTDKSGYCIVTSAEKDGVELLAVVLGSDSISDRYEDCIDLFDYGFDNYSYQNLINTNEVIETLEINGATRETKTLNVIAKNEIDVLVKNSTDISSLNPTIQINENLSAPIAKDTVVGTISYEIDGVKYETDLIAENSVEASNFETILFRALLIFLILCLLVVILKKLNKPRTPKKQNSSYIIKHSRNSKRAKSKKGGRYKFTQINDFL